MDQLHGASIVKAPRRCRYECRNGSTLADKLTAQGETPHMSFAGGGSNPIGALGYVNCVRELVEQADDIGVDLRLP